MIFLPLLQVFLAIFGVMDPVGNVPVFLTLTGKFDQEQRNKLATSAIIRAGIILAVFVFLGAAILSAFQISLESFRIAGGLILTLLGLQILFSKDHESSTESSTDISVVPLATPLIAGPGMITSAVILAKTYGYTLTLIGIGLNLVLSKLLFRYSHLILKILGEKGTMVFAKVMGLLIVAMGIEFIKEAMKGIFVWAAM